MAVRPAGKMTRTWWSRWWPRMEARETSTTTVRQAQRACRALEQQFGLRSLEARTHGLGRRELTPGEIAADRRRGRGVGEREEHEERSNRRRLQRVVRAGAGASQNEREFVIRLREHGLQVRSRCAEGAITQVIASKVVRIRTIGVLPAPLDRLLPDRVQRISLPLLRPVACASFSLAPGLSSGQRRATISPRGRAVCECPGGVGNGRFCYGVMPERGATCVHLKHSPRRCDACWRIAAACVR